MQILVINCGSSSLKYALFDMPAERVAASGHVDRIGPAAHHRHDGGDGVVEHTGPIETIEAAVGRVADLLKGLSVDAVGHRVVHGADRFHRPALIDAEVIAAIGACSKLAPLHNPANLAGIHACREAFKNTAQVAVFDTAFFQSLDQAAFRYAVPVSWTNDHGVRRYGFHGTSHRYATLRAGELLGTDTPDLITIHLGNGCSMACVRDGKAIDTTMGMTPLEGLVMGTRSGDVDPGMIFHLLEAGVSIEEVYDGLQHSGGLLAVSGVSSDMRDVLEAERGGDADASLAVEVFIRRVRKYLGSYLLQLPRCDAVVFTGGIGQHAPLIRRRILADLGHLGIRVDSAANDAATGQEAAFHLKDSPIQLWTIPANEELLIARETARAAHA
jgi:acetate kinase